MKRAFKEQFSYDPDANSDDNSHTVTKEDEDRTVQSYKEDADINVMIRRFGISAVAKPQEAGFYDFTNAPADYMEALNAINEADRRFATVPAEIRARHENNPAKFAAWLHDENNADEARKLGLLKPLPEIRKPIEVRVIPEPQEKPIVPLAGS